MRRASIIAAVGLGLLLSWGEARGDVYERVDENGVVHLTNIRPTGPARRRYRVVMRTPPIRRPRRGVHAVRPTNLDPGRFTRYDAYIREASRLYAIPEAFIRAVIHTESNYYPRAVSSCGAQGLMQLMPQTARRMGVRDPFDPRQNILGGTRYLRYLANLFNGDIVLTIAAYHAGENAVIRYRGVPPYETTQRYVPTVLRHYYEYRQREEQARRVEAHR